MGITGAYIDRKCCEQEATEVLEYLLCSCPVLLKSALKFLGASQFDKLEVRADIFSAQVLDSIGFVRNQAVYGWLFVGANRE